MRKTLIASLLLSFNLKAENNISYDYLDFGLSNTVIEKFDFNSYNASISGSFIKGSFDISKSFYAGGFYDFKSSSSFSYRNTYGLFMGYHKNLTKRTDFYTELDAARIDSRGFDSNIYGVSTGSRTAFTENFELISRLGYKHTHETSHGELEAALTGLFKFNEKHAVFLELEADDDINIVERKLGYRFSF